MSKSKWYQHTSVIFKLGWFIGIFDGLQKYLSWNLLIGWSWANQGISLVDHFIWMHMSWLNWINMQYCLLWDDWMDNWLVVKFGLICVGYVHKMTFSKWIEWIYVLWKYSNELVSSLIHIWWSIAQVIEICPILKIWVSCDLSHVWVIKYIGIGLKFGMNALDLWYEML